MKRIDFQSASISLIANATNLYYTSVASVMLSFVMLSLQLIMQNDFGAQPP